MATEPKKIGGDLANFLLIGARHKIFKYQFKVPIEFLWAPDTSLVFTLPFTALCHVQVITWAVIKIKGRN